MLDVCKDKKKIWQCQKLTKQNKKNEFEFFWSFSVKFSLEEFLRVDSLNFRKRTVRDFQLNNVKFRTLRPKLY